MGGAKIEMKKLTNYKLTEYYEYNDEYCICIDEVEDSYEAWLFKKDYGFRTFILGLQNEQLNKDEFIDILEDNVEEYIQFYEEQLNVLEEEHEKI